MVSDDSVRAVTASSAWKWAALRRRLSVAGYVDFLASFHALSYRPTSWRTARNLAAPHVRILVDFLLLNEAVLIQELEGVLGASWHVLAESGVVLFENDGWVNIPDLILVFGHGLFLFVDPAVPDPTVYFGDDTLGLLTRLSPGGCDNTLDLCSGSGVQALFCALFSRKATAVEINPQARGILHLNVILNGLDDRVDVRGGSLFENLQPGERFDLVTANPPLVPFPDDLEYPFVGHGGHDGFAVTREIIRGLRTHLTADGRGQIIGLTFASAGRAEIINELGELASRERLDVIATFISSRAITPDTIKNLAGTAVSSQSLPAVESQLTALIQTKHATHLMTFCLSIRHGTGTIAFQNLTRINPTGLWHVV